MLRIWDCILSCLLVLFFFCFCLGYGAKANPVGAPQSGVGSSSSSGPTAGPAAPNSSSSSANPTGAVKPIATPGSDMNPNVKTISEQEAAAQRKESEEIVT